MRNYTPTSTKDTLYILREVSLSDLLSTVKEKWGVDVNLEDIEISSEFIHTRCLGYDLHDHSDWDEYLVITLS